MKKIVKLTESDLIRIVKKCIKEQSNINEQAWLRKLVGTSVDDLLRVFGDDAVKDIEVVLQRALSKPANFVAKNGINYLKSASGKEISMDTIEKAIKLVSQGKLGVDEVASYLPSKLADGSEFRSVFQTSLKRKTPTTQTTKLFGSVGKSFVDMAKQMKNWIQILQPKGNLSGWKFHVYSETLDDLGFLYEKLEPIARKWGAGFKLGSAEMMEKLMANQLQKGKGATLYLPTSVVKAGKQKEFLAEIESALSGYKTKGSISGDRMINDKIGYRYELGKKIDQNVGVDMNQYQQLYVSNAGSGHNIPGNPDLFY